MVFQAIGACALMRLMRADREVETDWLLFGPTDAEVVEDEAQEDTPFLMAAE